MLINMLKSRGFEVEVEAEESPVISEPVCDLTEDYESYRFTAVVVDDKMKIILTDRLRLSEQIPIEIFIVAKQLRLNCGEQTITLLEDVTSII